MALCRRVGGKSDGSMLHYRRAEGKIVRCGALVKREVTVVGQVMKVAITAPLTGGELIGARSKVYAGTRVAIILVVIFITTSVLTTSDGKGFCQSFREGEDTGKLSCLLGHATNT